MSRTPSAAGGEERLRRREVLTLIGHIAAGAVSGAVRAVVGWLLDH